MDVDQQICLHHKYGFCKFSQYCRKLHIHEICLETHCESQNCPKRHPKLCRFYSLYQRCKFGDYCAFKHSENQQVREIEELKVKLISLEKKNLNLNERLEVVEKMLAEKAASSDTTPIAKKSKKRRKVKQHPTPSPTHNSRPVSSQLVPAYDLQHEEEEALQTDNANDQVGNEKVLTAEEIAKLYEDSDPGE